MAAAKPTIVLVPGAWHKPEGFKLITSILEAAGYTCIGVNLPSVGASPPLENIDRDVEAIRAVVKPEVDADRDVLVLMHSYGSVPAGEAVKGLDKASIRKDGGRGGVSHMFYLSAFTPPKGLSLMDMLGHKDLPWFNVSEDKKTVTPDNPEDIFYADVPKELQASSVTDLDTFSYQCYFSKTSWEPWREIPSTFLFCTQDKAIPLEVQKGMTQGGKFHEETLETSHSPFLSQPQKTADAIRRAAGETV